MRHRSAEDKAACFDAGDLVDLIAGPGLDQFIDGAPKRACIAEKGGDVAEHDAGRRIIGDRPDRGAQVEFEFRRQHDEIPFGLPAVSRGPPRGSRGVGAAAAPISPYSPTRYCAAYPGLFPLAARAVKSETGAPRWRR